MSGFLERVLADKAAELERKRRERPAAELAKLATAVPVRDFRAAIAGDGRIIAEIKRRSPRVSAYRQQAACEQIATAYADNGAAAISIVTDESNFGTSLRDVQRVRAAVPLPVLVKDFIVHEYQVLEARAAGADAILLIARILDPLTLRSLLARSRELNLAVLVECHCAAEIEQALAGGADVIGINSRDLDSLTVSLDVTRELAGRIPDGILRVAESGISERAQIEELASCGVNAFLIGGALLNAEDPGRRLRELRGLSEPGEPRDQQQAVRIKVCGLTSATDAVACRDLGADYLGVIFATSPRQVTPEQACTIRQAVPGARLVGVFADADIADIIHLVNEVPLDLIQLHGQETPAYCAELREAVSRPLIKALSRPVDLTCEHLATYRAVDSFLFDLDKNQPAGNGAAARLLAATARAEQAGFRIFLAGGLAPANVRAAVSQAAPYAVDVCRGVEAAPGIKDLKAVAGFIQEVRNVPTVSQPTGSRPAGRFGDYGGQYVPETLMPCLHELDAAYVAAKQDPAFQAELQDLLHNFGGRPTPLYLAANLSEHYGDRARIYLKREDLNHTGAHKINNCLGQALLARRMSKQRIVAETGAGQHGVATATVAARMRMDCTIYMGELDIERQRPNVLRMKLLGAEIVPVASGTRTLKDATSEAIRDWVTNVETTYYILGSTVGPHPYPTLVRDFQAVIGQEAHEQILAAEGRLPSHIVACVGGGSNALGIFSAFLDDTTVRLFGVEAGGSSEGHAATLSLGLPGVLHGTYSYLLQDEDGQISPAHSLAPGLDYPGVGPEHSHLKDTGRVLYTNVTDEEALEEFHNLSRYEGILPALEPCHALAFTRKLLADESEKPELVIVNLSGRGDKDVASIEERLQS